MQSTLPEWLPVGGYQTLVPSFSLSQAEIIFSKQASVSLLIGSLSVCQVETCHSQICHRKTKWKHAVFKFALEMRSFR